MDGRFYATSAVFRNGLDVPWMKILNVLGIILNERPGVVPRFYIYETWDSTLSPFAKKNLFVSFYKFK